ncbi:hypothetical protein ABEB36_007264 [Hypothenemus hampei]|uniref:Glucose-methanol-choline oxidoreductase N-terminal domain-containing protein n=1 Tax=Hypothenemus hampei TaxID=57062 RepID=A0ABD1ETF7_HYPHA
MSGCNANLEIYDSSIAGTSCPNIGCSLLYFMSLVQLLLRDTCQISDANNRITPKTNPDPDYDFVIIGSGTAGSTVAGRLAEIGHWKILLLEAGNDEPAGTQVPSFSFSYQGSSIDWQFKTEPEPVGCQGFDEKRCSWPRGKVLGGTSVINGMMFMRGTQKDYQRWVDIGNDEWSFEKILDDFKSYENAQDVDPEDAFLRGQGGPVTIEKYPDQPPFAWDILKAGKEIGYNVSNDLNGKMFNGFAVAQMNSRNGVRLSLAKAFVRPQKNNPNFHVMLNSTATKILVQTDASGIKRAYGVEFMYNGHIYQVNVIKEVIVSAGAVQTPQILLLSGIGDKNQLQSVGIQQIHDLPAVGRGLKNHVSFELGTTLNQKKANLLNSEAVSEYIRHQKGPMSSTGLAQVTARIHSKYSTVDDPDIQFYFYGFCAKCPNSENATDELEKVYIYPTYLHSKSRGYIGLHSKDPFTPPKIVANYLTQKSDLEGLRAGVRIAQKLISSTIFQEKYGMKLDRVPYGNCGKLYKWDSDEFWNCALKFKTGHENHQGSSCRMGPRNFSEFCVNQKLQLYGIENIRLIDASVFPDLPSANPQATIIMVAERGSRFIKEYYLNKVRRK